MSHLLAVQHLNPPPPPPHHKLSAPELSSVTPQIASKAVQSLLSSQLRSAGYDSAQPLALRRLELEVVAGEIIIAMMLFAIISLGGRVV